MTGAWELPDDLRPWLAAARDAADPTRPWPGAEWLIVTSRADRADSVARRLGPLLDGRATPRGEAVRLLIVIERGPPKGNLGGALAAWRAALDHPLARRHDLRGRWGRGEARAAIAHAGGLGRRAEPLTTAEAGDRSGLLLPGRIAGRAATLLTAVVAQTAPLALSQPAGFLDVIWSSQLFFPRVAPDRLPAPTAPLTKLAIALRLPPPTPDVGLFLLDAAGQPVGFVPQRAGGATGLDPSGPRTTDTSRRARGAADAERAALADPSVAGLTEHRPGALAADLGSFRIRADLLNLLLSVWDGSPADLDPSLTGPLLGAAAPGHLARAAAALDRGGVALCDVGADAPWWRLRRPSELRDAALDLRPSVRGGEPLRRMLGIDAPIARTWLGGRRVDPGGASFAEVRDGVVIDGVALRDAIVHDAELRPGSTLDGAVASWWVGGVDAERSWLVAGGGRAVVARSALVWRVARDVDVRGGVACDAGAVGVGPGGLPADRPRPWPPDDPTAVATASEAPVEGGPFAAPSAPRPGPPLPDEILDLLRAMLPAGDLRRLVDRPGLLGLTAIEACPDEPEPFIAVGRALTGGRLPLVTDRETARRLAVAPRTLALAIVRALALAFGAPTAAGRAAFADRAVAEAVRLTGCGPSRAAAVAAPFSGQAPPPDALGALAGWALADDPDRRTLDALFADVDRAPPELADVDAPERAWAWLRWRLDHLLDDPRRVCADLARLPADVRAAVAAPTRALGPDLDLFESRGAPPPDVTPPLPGWIPAAALRPTRPPDEHLGPDALADHLVERLSECGGPRALGLCGPAAAGKSWLARAVADRLRARGLNVAEIRCDALTWPGPGLRYTQRRDDRLVHLYGPSVFDDARIARAIIAARASADRVIADGVFLGLDPDVQGALDLRVGVLADVAVRLRDKLIRDGGPGGRRIDVVADLVRKGVHEDHDGVRPLLPTCHLLWDRPTGAVWRGSP